MQCNCPNAGQHGKSHAGKSLRLAQRYHDYCDMQGRMGAAGLDEAIRLLTKKWERFFEGIGDEIPSLPAHK